MYWHTSPGTVHDIYTDDSSVVLWLETWRYCRSPIIKIWSLRMECILQGKPVSAMTWGHNDKRLFLAVGCHICTAWVGKKVSSLQLICKRCVQLQLKEEPPVSKLPLPSKLRLSVASLFNSTIKVRTLVSIWYCIFSAPTLILRVLGFNHTGFVLWYKINDRLLVHYCKCNFITWNNGAVTDYMIILHHYMSIGIISIQSSSIPKCQEKLYH